MERSELLDQLRKILVDDLFVAVPAEEIQPQDELGPKLGLDSIGFIELATIVSDRYKIKADENDVAEGHFATLDRLCNLILSRRGESRDAQLAGAASVAS
ncbi:MAG TPA: acyl carrier protein [Myxococcaceae bacterium]|nr:acyl carrier protein [Myxococcaceae bacterium]